MRKTTKKKLLKTKVPKRAKARKAIKKVVAKTAKKARKVGAKKAKPAAPTMTNGVAPHTSASTETPATY